MRVTSIPPGYGIAGSQAGQSIVSTKSSLQKFKSFARTFSTNFKRNFTHTRCSSTVASVTESVARPKHGPVTTPRNTIKYCYCRTRSTSPRVTSDFIEQRYRGFSLSLSIYRYYYRHGPGYFLITHLLVFDR